MNLGGLHSAERLAKLVEAGDLDTIPLARARIGHVYTTERTALYAKLYVAGDNESLDLAFSQLRMQEYL